jgi:hypothetical protein
LKPSDYVVSQELVTEYDGAIKVTTDSKDD